MEISKKRMMFILIYVISFAVYAVLVFTLIGTRTPVFWISFIFMALAFAVQFFLTGYALNSDVEAVFFGIPLISLSVFYFYAEFVVSILMMIFQNIGLPASLVIQVVLLGIFAVACIMSLLARDTVQKIDKDIKEQVLFIRSLTVNVEMLEQKCIDPALKKELSELSEAIRYSDPITHQTVALLEQKIMQGITKLEELCSANDIKKTSDWIKELNLLIAERNKKLYMIK